jgi:pyruvate dehydrogenase complex dehydrogenase (E1) component
MRATAREYFEVSADYISHAALVGLFRNKSLSAAQLKKKISKLEIDPEKLNPMDR